MRDARVALGGVATVPWRAREAEALLKGQKFDDDTRRPRGRGGFRRRRGRTAQRIQDRARPARGGARAAPGRNDGGLTMSIAAPEPKANMGQPIPRYDAVAKVTGKAEYAADVAADQSGLCLSRHQFDRQGPHRRLRSDGAPRQVRGVIDIVTHENAEKLKEAKLFSNGGYAATTIQPLKSAEIAQDGQIVAVVLAETFEAAREAAHRVKVNYTAATPDHDLRLAGNDSARAKGQFAQFKEDPKVGDFAKAFDEAEVKVTPPMKRRPSTTIRWSCSRPVASGTATA